MTIDQLIKKWQSKLDILDIELLIAYQIKQTRIFVITHSEYNLNFWQNYILEKKLNKRAKNIPLAYLIGVKEFYGRKFLVNKNTLVPRPETELIIDLVLKKYKQNPPLKNSLKKYLILDIGTGSGNIILTLAQEFKKLENTQKSFKTFQNQFQFVASDISRSALKVAKKNCLKFNLKNKITFFHSNLLQNTKLQNKLFKFNDEIIIIANLPYVNKDFKNNLLQKKDSRALKFEPDLALWSDDSGLAHYHQLLTEIKALQLSQSSSQLTLYFEINPEQTKLLTKKIKNFFPQAEINYQKDLANLTRLAIIKIV